MAPRFVLDAALRGVCARWRVSVEGVSGAWFSDPRRERLRRRRVLGGSRCRGSIRRRVGFLRSRPSARITNGDRRKADVARGAARIPERASSKGEARNQAAPQASFGRRTGNRAAREPGVRQRPGIPCFDFGRRTALSRARAAGVGEDHAFEGSCPRSKLRQKSDDDVEAGTCNAEGNRSAASTG